MRSRRSSEWLALGALLLAACGGGTAPVARLAPDALFERGLEATAAQNWTQAIEAWERLVLEYPTHPRIQEARYRLGEAYFGKEEYVTAAGEFSRLATDFPAGAYADDARFKVCEAYSELSPRVQLDQEYTRAAVDHCRSLVAYYPSSEFVPRAQELIGTLENKLAEKVLVGGEFYFKRRAYDSAIIYFEEVVRQYPRSPAAPQALLRLVAAYEAIGYMDEAEAARERLLREYPNSAEAVQARDSSLANSS